MVLEKSNAAPMPKQVLERVFQRRSPPVFERRIVVHVSDFGRRGQKSHFLVTSAATFPVWKRSILDCNSSVYDDRAFPMLDISAGAVGERIFFWIVTGPELWLRRLQAVYTDVM